MINFLSCFMLCFFVCCVGGFYFCNVVKGCVDRYVYVCGIFFVQNIFCYYFVGNKQVVVWMIGKMYCGMFIDFQIQVGKCDVGLQCIIVVGWCIKWVCLVGFCWCQVFSSIVIK